MWNDFAGYGTVVSTVCYVLGGVILGLWIILVLGQHFGVVPVVGGSLVLIGLILRNIFEVFDLIEIAKLYKDE